MIDYKTLAWKRRRLQFIKEQGDGLHCSLCEKRAFGKRGGKKYKVHVHHTSYEFEAGKEPSNVLRILCPSCHAIITEILRRKADNQTILDLQTIITTKLNTN